MARINEHGEIERDGPEEYPQPPPAPRPSVGGSSEGASGQNPFRWSWVFVGLIMGGSAFFRSEMNESSKPQPPKVDPAVLREVEFHNRMRDQHRTGDRSRYLEKARGLAERKEREAPKE